MRKLYLLICLLILSFAWSCTQSSTDTETSTTTNMTTSTTSLDTWEQWLEERLDTELQYIESMIPKEITADFSLPEVSDSDISMIYYLDGEILDQPTITYIPSLEGIDITLTIELGLFDMILSGTVQITLIENETAYNRYLIDQTFQTVDRMLEDAFPSKIYADLYLPISKIEGVSIEYDVGTLKTDHQHVVFTFPEEDTHFTVTATIRYQSIIHILNFDIIMAAFDDLPNIPEIHISTLDNALVESKEEYVQATFSMIYYDSHNQPTTLINTADIQIRCRGNSTFYMPKKSYRIKFAFKTPLFTDHAEDDWVLLANFADQTLIRNYLAHEFSRSLDMEFSPSAHFVDVYLNDEYIGNYLLTDQIEVTNDRVDIEEKSSDIDTGYLLEMDKRLFDYPEGTEGVDYFIVYGNPYVIKSPKTDSEYYSVDQYNFIMDYIATVHTTLMNHQDYTALIDESSFIDWFIIQEIFENVDSGYSSVYMYKDKGDVLKMGPIWDFDLSLGNPGHLEDSLRKPEGWYTSLEYKNIWYYYLMQYSGFREHLKTRWNELYDNQIQGLIDSVYPTAGSIAKSRYMNFERWDIIGTWYDWYTAPEIFNCKTYEDQVGFMYDFLVTRILWLNEQINDF